MRGSGPGGFAATGVVEFEVEGELTPSIGTAGTGVVEEEVLDVALLMRGAIMGSRVGSGSCD